MWLLKEDHFQLNQGVGGYYYVCNIQGSRLCYSILKDIHVSFPMGLKMVLLTSM